MKTWAANLQKDLEAVGAEFVRVDQGGESWWECRLDGDSVSGTMRKSLGDCIRAAAPMFGE